MKKLSLGMILIVLAMPLQARASNSAVTATVTDTDGQVWSNGSWSATLTLPSGPFGNVTPTAGGVAVPASARGVLDANGMLSASLTDTSSLDQSGGQWAITVCPNASVTANSNPGCYKSTLPVVGATPNLSARFSGVPAPRFPAGANAFGYLDAEVIQPSVPGSSYYNTSADTSLHGLRLWDGRQWTGGSGTSSYFIGPPTVTVSGAAANHFVPVATGVADAVMRQLTQDDILPAFAISSFTCSICATVEAGVTSASPASGAASYTSLPVSASVSDGTNSTALTTPFTAWSLAHTYCTTAQGIGSTTFTLTAIGATTRTATQTITCAPRYFGGVGTPGATSSITASGSSAVLSTSDVLASAGVANSQTGSVIGSYSPSGQSIYLLLTGGAHTFTDNLTGFAMSFNAPIAVTFTNQYGVAVSMFLYQTTFTLTGTFAPKVAS